MLNAEQVRAIIDEALECRSRVDAEIHSQHHRWIEERIEAEKARREMFFELAKAVAQWSVVGLLGAAWYWFKGHIQWHL